MFPMYLNCVFRFVIVATRYKTGLCYPFALLVFKDDDDTDIDESSDEESDDDDNEDDDDENNNGDVDEAFRAEVQAALGDAAADDQVGLAKLCGARLLYTLEYYKTSKLRF